MRSILTPSQWAKLAIGTVCGLAAAVAFACGCEWYVGTSLLVNHVYWLCVA